MLTMYFVAGFLAMMAASVSAGSRVTQVASNSQKEVFTALAVNVSNVGQTGATPIDIVIERWTGDAERDRLMMVFKEDGPDRLLSALRETKRVGSIRTPDTLAYDLHYARQIPGEDGGRRIVLATDRPIGFWEAKNRPRTFDYPFTLIELQVDDKGEGVGKLSIATKITLNGNVLTLENFANQPVMLKNVHKRK